MVYAFYHLFLRQKKASETNKDFQNRGISFEYADIFKLARENPCIRQ